MISNKVIDNYSISSLVTEAAAVSEAASPVLQNKQHITIIYQSKPLTYVILS